MNASVVWFRDDLRLSDNPALAAAIAGPEPVHCLYCLDDDTPGHRPLGGAARWWLDQSLRSLKADIERLGGALTIRRGPARAVIETFVRESGASRVVWNRRYGRAERETDAAIKAALRGAGVVVESFNASLLHEPWEIETKTGGPMKVFSPFWRACLAKGPLPAPKGAPAAIKSAPAEHSLAVDDLALHPTGPDWSAGLAKTWSPGEASAQARLAAFVDGGAPSYAENRDRPDLASTSGLSPHLRFGEISPRQVAAMAQHAQARGAISARDGDKFLAEIGWREFSYHLLFHAEDLTRVNVQRRFDDFPWGRNEPHFRAWSKGLTGYPIVDAGMRQLWQTGWMHNRVRMIVASFLVKHLLIDWREGETWFWDTLVDADPASNPASWQWVAGSGADAAPYFRIFNPMTQGAKFDPDGAYVRRYVPELAGLPAAFIHEPWAAPPETLSNAGITLGETYPKPLVEHFSARDRALAALKSLQEAA